MILVVSAYPEGPSDADDVMQRVSVVDMSLAGYSRAYLDISLKGHIFPEWEEVSPGVMVHRVNCFLHFWYILYLATKASMVYVHTLQNALRVLPLYLSAPIVTDLSLSAAGESAPGALFHLAETLVIRRSKALVLGAAVPPPAAPGLRTFKASPVPTSADSKALAAFVSKGENPSEDD